MEILIINLMRLGDLIQSGPVLRGLRTRYPQARISLLVMDLFVGAARLLPGADRLVAFPGTTLAPLLEQPGWPAALKELSAWLRQHLRPCPDVVVNLTPTVLAGLLARLSGAPEVRGLWVTEAQELATAPAWASYSLVVSKARQANPFNVVDLFVRTAGLRPDGRGLEVTATNPALPPRPPGIFRVGLCPGASQPERQWPPENFAQAARLLLARLPCHFLIFGSAAERPLGEALMARLPAGSGTLLAGETDLPALVQHLAELDLLITNDTGPMHLAAAVGTPVVALFLAGARAQDTGPAGTGHAVLEPHLPCHPCLTPCARRRCHAALPPEAVAAVAGELLTEGHQGLRPPTGGWETVRLYHTALDPEGYQAVLPAVRRPLSLADFWRAVHRLAWVAFLDGPIAPRLVDWQEMVLRERYAPPAEDPLPQGGLEPLAELLALARRGEETAARLAGLVLHLRPGSFHAGMSALSAVDQGLRSLAVAHPQAAALVGFFFQEQRHMTSREVPALAEELCRAYGRLRRLAELCQETALRLADALRLALPLAQSLQKAQVRALSCGPGGG